MATEEKLRLSSEFAANETEPSLPTVEKPSQTPPSSSLHPAVYVIVWIVLSSNVILFNKWLLDKKKFHYPISLTAWHLIFATIMTQILARTTKLLDGRKNVTMTGRVYLRAIVPIGMLFSCSLIFGNLTYLYLSVAFIQMLKATTPVAVLVVGWIMGVSQPNLGVLFNVSFIVLGVVVASFGEITFVLIGFIYQCAGIAFESTRLVLVQKLLNGDEYKMDPLVSLYYYAPVCAIMNAAIALVMEIPYITKDEIFAVGLPILFANALVAFLLNVSAVFLIGKTSSLVMALCGILKDTLLVIVSMLIWDTPVTRMQWFGYAIAVSGLVYYKLGAEQLKLGFDAVGREWAGFSVRRPILRILVIFCGFFFTFALIVGSLTPTYIPDYKDRLAAGVAKVGGLVDGIV